MNKRIFAALCFVLAAVIMLPTLSSSAYGQKPEKAKMKKSELETTKATRSASGAKGATDPNITQGELANDESRAPVFPAGKSGAKGAVRCGVLFDNYTNLVIKAYVDGSFEGTISRLGELAAYPVAGSTVVYARADFTDGTVRTWGPVTFNCSPGSIYTWKITD